MKPLTLVLSLALGATTVTACDDGSTSPPPGGSSTVAIAPDNPQAHGTIRGTVAGPVGADTMNFEPVPNVTVRAFGVSNAAGDSVPPELVAEVVTDAEGRFQIIRVPAGGYTLAALPPADTPYLASGTYALTSTGSNTEEVTIHLGWKP